ncbi:MAG TPA: hypothetical protein VFY81_07780 [Gammaproteobacteria bacterium]|nr:hypothetical protein [Gammaproteobacteria bacterium]
MHLNRTGLLTALMLLGLIGAACATPLSRNLPAESAAMPSYVWYDGDNPRRAWLDPEVIAVFDDSDQAAARAVRSLAPNAILLPSSTPGLRLWRIPADGDSTIRSLRSLEPEAQASPVLRDAPSKAAPMRALPGQIIVYLNPDWSEPEARAWLQAHGLDAIQQLNFGHNVFLLRSEPGLASLELANRLRQQPGVAAAMPNWWQELETR